MLIERRSFRLCSGAQPGIENWAIRVRHEELSRLMRQTAASVFARPGTTPLGSDIRLIDGAPERAGQEILQNLPGGLVRG